MSIDSFGILNRYRCRPPNNKLPEEEPGAFCKRLWDEELHKWNPKVIVPLGAVGLNALVSEDMSITRVRGRLFSVDGTPVLPMLHPAYLLRNRAYWRDWELDMEKLRRFLDGKSDYISLSNQHVTYASTPEQAAEMLRELLQYKKLSCDVETASYNMPWENGDLLSIAFSWSPSEAYSMPFRFARQSKDVYAALKHLLESSGIAFWWYNGLYDVQHVWSVGINARIDGDAMLEMHMHDERLNVHDLKGDSGVYLDAPNWEEPIKKHNIPNDKSPEAQAAWRQIPEAELLTYNGYDTTHTIHLSQVVRERLGEKLCWYNDNILVPAYRVLARARAVGLRVDIRRIQSLRSEIQPVLDELSTQMCAIAHDSFFNPRSPQQVLNVLRARGIKAVDTRKETLEEYAGDEMVDAIRDYRDADKMFGTYILGIVDDICDDMRVHPDWKLPTETGRLRCGNPNMLGMPRKAEVAEHKWKRFIKEIWIADSIALGYSRDTLLMHIDRRQSEVRCNIFLANAVGFMQHLIDNPEADIHSEYAIMLFGLDFTYEQRFLAKMIVTFAVPYGAEADSVARRFTAAARQTARKQAEKEGLGPQDVRGTSSHLVGLHDGVVYYHIWSVREAQKVIDDFFAKMPEVKEAREQWKQTAITEWELTNYFGRVRRFGLVTPENYKHVRNEAYNFPPSSLSNDINLLSCVATMEQFGKYGVEVLVPIHDAALIRLPKESSAQLAADIQGVWEALPTQYLHTKLPFPCEVTLGERWSDL